MAKTTKELTSNPEGVSATDRTIDKYDPESDAKLMKDAIDFVMENNKVDGECPFCSYKAPVAGDNNPVRQHLLLKHSARCIYWASNPELGPDAMSIVMREADRTIEPIKHEGVEVTWNENPGMLDLPNKVRKRLESHGHYGRWVSPEKIRQRINQGYVVTQLEEGEDHPYKHDHNDRALRCNEMVHMHFDREHRERWLQQQRRKVEAQGEVLGRAEDAAHYMSDVGKATYENAIRSGMDSRNAHMMANNADKAGRVFQFPSENARFHRR